MSSRETLFEPLDYDDKTGLLNESGLLKILTHLSQEVPGNFSVLSVDLDRLKAVNDQFGHAAGDQYLFDTGTVLSTSVRTERQDEVAARIHGDEFVIVLPGISDPAILEMVRSRVEHTLDLADKPASIGGRSHQSGEAIEKLLTAADRLMYKKKRERKQAAFDNLPKRKKVAGWLGDKLIRYSGVNPPRL